MTRASQKRAVAIPLSRVQFLADMIFATSMTIMVLNFDMPSDQEISTESDLLNFFASQRDALLTYIISFLLVFIYWMKHLEHFSHIKDTSSGHVWLQAGFLMFLMVIPVGNNLYSTWPEHPRAATFYCFIVLMVGVFSFLSWRYATKDHRLVEDDLDEGLINDIKWETLVEPAAALVAIFAIWFVNPDL
ncbi:TMEM175 family protein, partial [Bacteroidota bacterium]